MLVTLAALQLFVLAQASPPAQPPDAAPPTTPAPRSRPAVVGDATDVPPPILPPAAEPPAGTGAPAEGTPPAGTGAPAEGTPPAGTGAPAEGTPPAGSTPPRPEAPRRAAPAGSRQQSLFSAEPLRGGSAAAAWAGWSSLGAEYAIGFTAVDDGGVFLDFDWAKSETRIGALYRRPLGGRAGPFEVGGRLALSWYENFGSTYIYDDNHSDRGFEITPGVALSTHGAGGILSGLVEAPMTVTAKHERGFLFSPRVSVAFEAPLYPSVTVGAKIGVGYRAGAGDAPLREGRTELQFLVLAGYQLL